MYLSEDNVAQLSKLHEQFIKSILEMDKVYYIKNDENLAIIDAQVFEGYEAIPFFTTFEQALKFQQLHFEGYDIVHINTKKFLENWMISLLEMELALALIWSDDLNGKELSPYDMMVDSVAYITERKLVTDINTAEITALINSL